MENIEIFLHIEGGSATRVSVSPLETIAVLDRYLPDSSKGHFFYCHGKGILPNGFTLKFSGVDEGCHVYAMFYADQLKRGKLYHESIAKERMRIKDRLYTKLEMRMKCYRRFLAKFVTTEEKNEEVIGVSKTVISNRLESPATSELPTFWEREEVIEPVSFQG